MAIYRGPCEDLYGQEIPDPPEHDCLDHLRHVSEDCVETHGLDCGPYERWTDEGEECTVCKERYTDREVERLWQERLIRFARLEPPNEDATGK